MRTIGGEGHERIRTVARGHSRRLRRRRWLGRRAAGFSLSNLEQAEFFVTADPLGEAWLIVGTDSGHEGTTSIFYTEIEAMFIEA
ncbi:MAG: hypothetical protein ACREQ8_18770, partial [Woeseiaceae bacterium]